MGDVQLDFKSSIRSFLTDSISLILDVHEQSIDFRESFTSLGGDSITAIALVSACKRTGVNLNTSTVLLSKSVEDIVSAACTTRLQEDEFVGLPSPFELIGCEKRSRIMDSADRLSRKRKFDTFLHQDNDSMTGQDSNSTITCVPKEEQGLLTEMQDLLLQNRGNDETSNVITYSETYKLSDLVAVKAAWERTAAQEPLLRCTMTVDPNDLAMRSTYDTNLQWDEIETDSHEDFEHRLQTDPEPMAAGVRFRVIKLDRGLHREGIATVIWQVHHALIDGYAASLIHGNFQNALNGRPIRPCSPFSKIAQQLRALQEYRTSEARQFWKLREPSFQAAVSELKLPKPIFNPRRKVGSMSKVVVQSPVAELNEIAQQLNCTLTSIYTTAWSIVLSRYFCSDCVLFGIITSGRSLPLVGVENAVGPLINTLPLCVRLNQNESLSNLIRTVFEELALLIDMEFSRASDGFERSFSSAIAMQFDMESTLPSTVQPIQKAELHISSEVPLSICIDKTGEIQLFYQDAHFKESDMMLVGEHFERTLKHMLDHSNTVGSCLDDFLTDECRQGLAMATNSRVPTTRTGFRSDSLISLFQRSASQYAELTAIEKDDLKISYLSLHRSVLHLADRLYEAVKSGDAVCILADQSINWIIGIYAVLFLGGVYVPLNPASCSEAREVNFGECRSQVFLTPYDSQSQYSPATCRTSFSIESILSQELEKQDTMMRRGTLGPDSAAYICFTSGSTGRPKAVVCSHEGLVAFQSQLEVRLMAGPGIKIAQIMSPVFDGSIHEIFSALSYGATLVLAPSTGGLVKHLSTVDSTIMTPSLAAALDPEAYSNLKSVYLVGEAVPQKVCDAWAVGRRLYNMYGPTEATCGATITRLHLNRPVTIGKPNLTSRIYILDHNKRETPPGITGEIYLAGVQVAKGYMGRPEETQTSFLRDTVCPDFGEMMYRTGDFGYWSSIGEIVCVGRKDRQIKLRGFRLDLNNLESRIAEALPVASGVAVTHKQGQLIVMIRPSSLSIDKVRYQLSQTLEPHFVPQHVILVDEFPLSTAGKVDYAKIANTVRTNTMQESLELTARTEVRLCHIWRETLDITDTKTIDASSNFLSLGGHSITQLIVLGRIERTFGCHLDKRAVLDLLTSGTLRDLARLIDMQPPTLLSSPEPEHMSNNDSKPDTSISDVEMQWWHLHQKSDQTSQFNVSLAWELTPGRVDTDRLAKAWDVVLERYSIFRSRYVIYRSKVKRVHTLCAPQVSRVAHIDVDGECNRPFNLEKDCLIRVTISPSCLLVCASHIVLDLTAAQTVLAEVGMAYAGQTLTGIPRSYAASLKCTTTMSPKDVSFWKDHLTSAIDARRERLALDSARSSQGSSLLLRLGPDALKDLESVAHRYRVTKHQIALAAVSMALTATDTPQLGSDLLIGAPWNNRNAENHDVVGLFLELLPIVLPRQCNRDERGSDNISSSPAKLLHEVRQSSQSSLAHAVPWSSLCQLLNIRPQGPGVHLSPLMLLDAMVTFHEQGQSMLAVEGLSPVMTWSQGSKFRIMFEFSACENGELVLRVEYNSSIYDYVRALDLTRSVCRALGTLGCASAVDEEFLVDQASTLFGRGLD